MMNKTRDSFYLLTVFALLIASCAPQPNATPTVVDVENAVMVQSTPTNILLSDILMGSPTPEPVTATETPLPAPTDVLSLIGTPLPQNPEPINVANYMRLKRISQWGRGSIQGVSFTPNGRSFIAISEMGWSIYNMDTLDQPPLWVSFDKPMLFDEFYFNSEGTMVKFYRFGYKKTDIVLKEFPTGKDLEFENGTTWLKPNVVKEYSSITASSPDGTKIFNSGLDYEYNEAIFSEEKTFREMHDSADNLLYSLRDDAPYVTYSDRNGPEGCDLSVFSPCGNALMALATAPAKILFSSDSSTFALLYSPPSLIGGILRSFSYLRIYESDNGDLIGSLGGFTQPVQDFGYSPDGTLLVAGFVDGSIVLWDVHNAKSIFGARHMNAPIDRIEYSGDGKHLLIQRGEELEVRQTTDGGLLYRYNAVDFAISAGGDLLALGDYEGNIQIRSITTGEGIWSIKAHEDRIYSLAFSPDGLYLASSGRDCDIKLWNARTGKLLHYFEETTVDAYEMDLPSRIFSTYLEFIPGHNMLVGFGSWGTVVNWNVNSGATNYVIQSSALEYYNGMITVKPHFPEFFTIDDDNNRFYINENGFDLPNGSTLGPYKSPENLQQGCAPMGPRSSDQKLILTMGYESLDGKICVLDATSLQLLHTLDVPWANWLYISPDGKQLAVVAGSGIVYIFQVA